MKSSHVVQVPVTISFASAEVISTNFKSWWVTLVTLGNGPFFGQKLSIASVLYLICGALTLGGVIQMLRLTSWSFPRDLREDVESAPFGQSARGAPH